MLRISQIKINISEFYRKHKENIEQSGWVAIYDAQEMELVKKKARALLECKDEELLEFHIVKRSIDARKKQEICYNYSVDVELGAKKEQQILKKDKKHRYTKSEKKAYMPGEMGNTRLLHPPVVIGFGPAGMFCALELAKAGYRPIVLEQGMDVDSRMQAVEQFWKDGTLQQMNNVQFGEGGAGTFSDGKLNTGVKDPSGRNYKVLQTFVEHGAKEQILYEQKPHLGTDVLCQIVKNIRTHIEELGGEVRFSSQVTNLRMDEQNRLNALEINGKEWMETEIAVLAIGHSARETFSMLQSHDVSMEQKPFAIGVRVEHAQKMIDEVQYGDLAGILPAADYKLTYQAQTGRSIFSFCMCPGGFVVNASSEPERMVVNGMSNQDRAERNANSALVVNVTPEDFESEDVLAGVTFQRKWESLAFAEGHGKVPVQRYGDFKKKRISDDYGAIKPVHKGKVTFGNLWNCLPEYVCDTLLEGVEAFGRKISGFSEEDALLSGVETRTSSPVRIVRNEQLQSNIEGLYPCGEGAGYAGGITSAAMDGLKVYESIRAEYKPFNE